MKHELALPAALIVAAWTVFDAWLIYGTVQHMIWRLT